VNAIWLRAAVRSEAAANVVKTEVRTSDS
jgi:hypothetical protein